MRILSIFLVFIVVAGFGQSPGQNANIYALNSKYLEHLIKTKIDSVRADHGLKPLVNDSILYVAAKYHADWLKENKKFSHYQKDKNSKPIDGFYSPQDRAESHGAPATYLVGENIIKSFLNKKIQPKKGREYVNRSYEDLANDFVIGWVNSPGHYKNIITAKYDITGLAISVNPEKKMVIAVQKFADVLYQYAFTENQEMFSYSDYVPPPLANSFDEISRERIAKKFAWKIKSPKDSTERCSSCNYLIDNRKYKDQFFLKGRKIIYKTWNVAMINEIVRKRRDGLAVELVSYRPYDCDNPEYYTQPSRRNNQSIFNYDTILRPLYRRELKKGFRKCKRTRVFKMKKRETADYFELTLGRLPKELDGYHEMNLVVLKGKKLCRIVHFTNYCGEPFQDTTVTKFVVKFDRFPYTRPAREALIHFEVAFERGKHDYQLSDIQPLLGAFNQTVFTIDSAYLNAYSSLEGSDAINRNLQLKRAQAIMDVLKETQQSDFPRKIVAEPNWAKFDEQIDKIPALKELKGLSHEEIKKKLSDADYAMSIEQYLAKQRLAILDLKVRYDIKREYLADTLLSDLKQHYKDSNGKPWQKYVAQVQYLMFQLVQEKLCSLHKFDKVETYITAPWLAEQTIWLNYRLQRFQSDEDVVRRLIGLKSPSSIAQYNELNYRVRNVQRSGYVGEKENGSILGLFGVLRQNGPERFHGHLDTLELTYYMILVNLYGFNGQMPDERKLNGACIALINHAKTLHMPEAYNLRIAKLFVDVERDPHAYNWLKWMLENGAEMDETKALFLKMGYYHNQEFHNRLYHAQLIEYYDQMQEKNWCEMFIGDCNISFQVFDDEVLRDFYCERCGEYYNYAKHPEDW